VEPGNKADDIDTVGRRDAGIATTGVCEDDRGIVGTGRSQTQCSDTGKRKDAKATASERGKKKGIVTRLGWLSYERQYYYDVQEQQGSYPLDEQLGIEQQISAGMSRVLVKLGADRPYQSSADLVNELMQVSVSDTSAWRSMQKAGEKYQAMLSGDERRPAESPQTGDGKVMGTTMDGFMVNVRGEKESWREVKVGCVFEIRPENTTKVNKALETIPIIRACEQAYVTHLGEPEPFAKKFIPLTQTKTWKQASETAVIGDGAVWIWNIAQTHFADSAHVVDWYHAKQHLWTAAHLIHPADSTQAAIWVKQQSDALYDGQASTLAQTVSKFADQLSGEPQKNLLTEAGYFDRNHERMQYHDFQLGGIPIGSGTVEAGAKQYKHRFTATGMRWSRQGLNNALALPFRDALLSRQFDSCWRSICPN
jgi:Uncharacterised protein family (UPF0236)